MTFECGFGKAKLPIPTACPHSLSASVSQSLRQYFMQITAELCHGSDDNDDSLDNCQ